MYQILYESLLVVFFSRKLRRLTQTLSAQISVICGKANYRITFVNTGALSFSTVT